MERNDQRYALWILLTIIPGCLCIVGDPAKVPQPSYAIIRFSDWLLCGGALVAPNLIATTASCVVRPFGKPHHYTVILGAVDRSIKEDTQQEFGVTDIIVHPDYVKNIEVDGSSDLALLRLDGSATIVPGAVEIATIAFSKEDDKLWDDGEVKCSINGFGLTSFGDSGTFSNVRRAIEVKGSSQKNCKDMLFPMTFKLSTKKQTCCYAMYKSTCVGDEGSPLICPRTEGEGEVLVGIVQFSTCRMSSVIMFTRLSHFQPWIMSYA